MVAELNRGYGIGGIGCSLAKISMVAEPGAPATGVINCCSLAKISMVAELLCLML